MDKWSGFDQNATINDDTVYDEETTREYENEEEKKKTITAEAAAILDEDLASEMVIIKPGKTSFIQLIIYSQMLVTGFSLSNHHAITSNF